MERQIVLRSIPYSLHELYDKYAGMLLGYITEIVSDAKLAEQHLVNIYNNLPKHLNEINADGCNVWCYLQRLTQKHLAGFGEVQTTTAIVAEPLDLKSYYTRNKFLSLMNDEQKEVFCYVYYKGKTTAWVASELGRSEEFIRKNLKEAFAIIKKAL